MMISRRHLIAWLSSLPAAAAFGTFPSSAAISTLREAAFQTNRFYGAAVRSDQLLENSALLATVLEQCSCVTPEIHLKWNSIENKRGQFWFEPVDDLIDLAKEHDLDVYGHALLWEQSTPSWALRSIRKHRDWALIEAHFERVLTRYGNIIHRWDVVNEPIDTQNGSRGLRRTSFFKAFGANYITRALETARRFAPNAHLAINDYSFEYDNDVDEDRRNAFVELLKKLKTDGAPLNGVGIQAHLDLGKGPLKRTLIAPFLARIADLGLDIVVTELDVKERDYRGSWEERDVRVADEVRRYLEIVLDQPAVRGITTWGLSDQHSWLKVEPGDLKDAKKYGPPAPNRGLPFDKNLAPKAMYQALHDNLSS